MTPWQTPENAHAQACKADLITGFACFLAVIDLQVGCSQVEVARLLDVC